MTSPCMPGSLYIILMCVHTERERGWTYSNNLYIHMYNTPLPTYLLYIYTYTSSYNTNPKILPMYNLAQQTSSTQLSSWPWTLQKRVRSSQVSCWFQVEQCSKPTSFRYTAWWIGISHSGLWYIVNQQAFWRLLMSWRALNPPAFCALAPSAGVENPPLNLKVLIGKITELNSRFHCHVWFLEERVQPYSFYWISIQGCPTSMWLLTSGQCLQLISQTLSWPNAWLPCRQVNCSLVGYHVSHPWIIFRQLTIKNDGLTWSCHPEMGIDR